MVVSLRTEQFKFDMGDYLGEKSLSVLSDLASASELLVQHREDMPKEASELLRMYIGGALWNVTKIVSLAHDAVWSTSDSSTILENGRDGLYDVLSKYGLASEAASVGPSFASRAIRLLTSIDTINDMLEGSPERGEVRTQICAELLNIRFQHPLVEEVRRLTENVTQRVLEWSEYLTSVRPLLRQLEAEVREKLPDTG